RTPPARDRPRRRARRSHEAGAVPGGDRAGAPGSTARPGDALPEGHRSRRGTLRRAGEAWLLRPALPLGSAPHAERFGAGRHRRRSTASTRRSDARFRRISLTSTWAASTRRTNLHTRDPRGRGKTLGGGWELYEGMRRAREAESRRRWPSGRTW